MSEFNHSGNKDEVVLKPRIRLRDRILAREREVMLWLQVWPRLASFVTLAGTGAMYAYDKTRAYADTFFYVTEGAYFCLKYIVPLGFIFVPGTESNRIGRKIVRSGVEMVREPQTAVPRVARGLRRVLPKIATWPVYKIYDYLAGNSPLVVDSSYLHYEYGGQLSHYNIVSNRVRRLR